MSFNMKDMNLTANVISNEISRQVEVSLMNQLSWLVQRGIIVIENQGPTLVTTNLSPTSDNYELKIQYGARLVLKDKEYIEQLEKENLELKSKLTAIAEATRGVV